MQIKKIKQINIYCVYCVFDCVFDYVFDCVFDCVYDNLFFKNDFSFYVYSNFVAAIGWIRIQLLRKFSGSGSILISYGGDKGNISSKSDPDSEH